MKMNLKKVHLQDGQFEVNPAIIGEGITQSEMQCMDNCPEQWYLGYNLMLTKPGDFSWALTYGSWIHSALEQWYSSKGKRWSIDFTIKDRQFIHQDLLAQEDYWKGVAQVTMDIYTSYFKQDFMLIEVVQAETVVDIMFEGVRLKGMVDIFARDLTVKKKKLYFAWDHKTASRFDKVTLAGWDFRLQFLFYCWIASKVPEWKGMPCGGLKVNGIRKPQLKQGKGETLDGFLQRLQSDMMERPEFYFYRETLLLKPSDLQHFEDNILRPKLSRIKLLLDPKTPKETKRIILRNKNTDHCVNKYGGICKFLPLCQHGWDTEIFQYKQREHKHMELLSENAE